MSLYLLTPGSPATKEQPFKVAGVEFYTWKKKWFHLKNPAARVFSEMEKDEKNCQVRLELLWKEKKTQSWVCLSALIASSALETHLGASARGLVSRVVSDHSAKLEPHEPRSIYHCIGGSRPARSRPASLEDEGNAVSCWIEVRDGLLGLPSSHLLSELLSLGLNLLLLLDLEQNHF